MNHAFFKCQFKACEITSKYKLFKGSHSTCDLWDIKSTGAFFEEKIVIFLKMMGKKFYTLV